MSPLDIATYLQSEWKAVIQAPALYLTSSTVVSLVTCFVTRAFYTNQIASIKSRIEWRDEQIKNKDSEIDHLKSAEKTLQINVEGVNLPKGKAFYEKWDALDSFPLYVAACLWNDEAPPSVYKGLSGDASARLMMLQEAIRKHDIDILEKRYAGSALADRPLMTVSRQELLKLAEKKNLRPKFLYPDAR